MNDDSRPDWPDGRIHPLDDELSLHLERAHELGERAKRANDNVLLEIQRAREIAERLRGQVRDCGR